MHTQRETLRVWLRNNALNSWGTTNSCQGLVLQQSPHQHCHVEGTPLSGRPHPAPKIHLAFLPLERSLLLPTPPMGIVHFILHPRQSPDMVAVLPVPSHQQISMATILQSWKEADKLDWKSLFCSCLHHAWQMDRLEASPAPSDQDVYFCLPLFPSFEPSLAVSPTGTLTLLVLFT